MGLTASKPNLEEQLKENKRMINRAVRELDREKLKLERDEQKIISEIRMQAKKNQVSSVKIMAKDLVRTRRYIAKFLLMKSHLQGINLRMQTVKSTESMAKNLKSTTSAMIAINKQLNLPELSSILEEFKKETEKLGISEDVMGDAIDDVLEDVGDAEAEESVVNQVLDEIGVDLSQLLSSVPKKDLSVESQKNRERTDAIAIGGSFKEKPPNSSNKISNHTNNSSSLQAPSVQKDPFFDEMQERLKALKNTKKHS